MVNETNVSNDILGKYLVLMEEIKRRKLLIEQTLTDEISIYDIELSYLQLRKILEIIVKAPLLVNELEYRRYSNCAEKDWHIKTIMEYLSQANPKYYPNPYIVTKHPSGHDSFEQRPLPYLSKNKLKKAYKRCNSFLHSTNPLIEPTPIEIKTEYEFIVQTLNESTALLETHLVHPSKSGFFYRVSMKRVGDGKASGQIFEAVAA